MARRSVLIADDDLGVVELVRSLLEEEEYEARVAYDGLQAVQSLQEAVPDLLVLDIHMPRLSGWDVLWEVRNAEQTQFLPVIILTVARDGDSITRGWSSGVDCYLAKPFDPDEFLTMVARLIQVNEDETIPGVKRDLH